MAEKGQVVELKKHLAVVKMVRTEACAKCKACTAGMTKKDMFIEADNRCNAVVGDWVEMELHNNGFLSAVLITCGIPLVALLAGMLVGYFLIAPMVPGVSKELISFALGILFTFIVFLWIRSQESRWESAQKYRPIAARVTEPEPVVE